MSTKAKEGPLKVLIPAKRGEWSLFLSAFAVAFLAYVNYQVLRNVKAVLVVTSAASREMAIAHIQLYLLLPVSVALTWALTRLMRRFSPFAVFGVTVAGFLAYFVIFAAWLFPYRSHFLVYGSFFTMAELWKVAVLSILFWGFLNRRLMAEQAKRFYAALAFAGSVGGLVGGPVTVYCMHELSFRLHPLSADPWHHGLWMVALVVALSGGLILLLFGRLTYLLRRQESDRPVAKLEELSLLGSVQTLIRSRYLRTLAAIVFFDYIAFNLGEIVFMGVLRQAYPDPNQFGVYFASLNTFAAIGTLMITLFVAPVVLRRCPWIVAGVATPFAFGLSAMGFFGAILLGASLPTVVLLGSTMFFFSRTGKLGLLDPAKELAFVQLDEGTQVRGKLVVDGVVGRMGRAGSSAILMTVRAAPWLAAVVGVCSVIWLRATLSLGSLVGELVDDDVARVGQE